MHRRQFLKNAVASTGAMILGGLAESADGSTTSSNAPALPRRPYGREGKISLSVIGFGGILVMNTEPAAAEKLVAEAVERGVNYFDVAPTYGNAQQRLGPALKPFRDRVFLACKTEKRSATEAAAALDQSLKTLQTDYFDLYQLHALTDLKKDVDAVFAADGAMRVLLEAKKNGRVRHLGFSAHSVEAAAAALDCYEFDSILFPINFATFYKSDFGPQIVAKAKEKGASILALKALARQKWPKDDPLRKTYSKCWYQPLTDPAEADLALRFTLSQPVTAAIPPGEEQLFRAALDIASRFTPVTEAEQAKLREIAAALHPVFPPSA